jgi:flagellar basal body-associated protein FliL
MSESTHDSAPQASSEPAAPTTAPESTPAAEGSAASTETASSTQASPGRDAAPSQAVDQAGDPSRNSAGEPGASPSGDPSGKKAGKKKKKNGAGLGQQIQEVLGGLSSPDRPTRNAALLFVVSLMGVVGVFIAGGVHFWQVRKDLQAKFADTGEQGENPNNFLKKQAEGAKRKFSIQDLGTFTIELKPIPGARPAPGVMNLAEIELQAECDEKETCDTLEEELARARNEVASVFTAMARDDLISKEGKRQLKKKIQDRLNGWLPKGRVEEIYISKLVIN